MQYRNDLRSGNKLSALGFGCMRFSRNPVNIDVKKAEQLILSAIEAGVNYFDTAYLYMGSEEALGRIFKNNPGTREKIFLATKLPLAMCRSYENFDRLFNIQLDRLNTDYIDYYFMHNLVSEKAWDRLCGLGVKDWIEEKKQEGKIKLAGFSFHGSSGEFLNLLNVYDWDFCQIQYNYVNTNYQAGTAGLKAAAKKGIPVIVMEPLLGGKLASGLPKEALQLFNQADRSKTPAAWALNWLWDQPEVTVVLSGMNSMEQLKENIALAEGSRAGMLGDAEKAVYGGVVAAFDKSFEIPCTGCNYCMPCPSGVNIPACFTSYNIYRSMGMITGFSSYLTSTAAMSRSDNFMASRCSGCKKCERHCPQNIEISKRLCDVKRKMEPFWIRAAMAVVGKMRSK